MSDINEELENKMKNIFGDIVHDYDNNTNDENCNKKNETVTGESEEKVNSEEPLNTKAKKTNSEETNNEETNNEETNNEETNSEKTKDELTIANEKIKDLEDKYKRLLAEFDNFRKRSEKENLQMSDFGASMILTKILPIVDNIERALQNIPEDIKENPFVDGINKTYKQVLTIFEELKVKPIEAKGKPFDQNFHNAVMTDETSDAETDTVTEELQKGWMFKDTVLRHSMVKVKK